MQPFATVIPKSRTVTLGGVRFAKDTFLVELQTQSVADVRSYIFTTTVQQTAQQIAIGNPPQLLTVDDRTGKPLEDVEKKSVVIFGVALPATAMRQVEIELASAISRATTARSGALAGITSSWQWLFIPKGGGPRTVTSAAPPASFASGDQLVLLPRDVPYATITNRNVVRGGRLIRRGWERRAAKSRQNLGFLATATAAVRSKSVFKQFSVSAVFSKNHMVAGEIMTRTSGTGMIVIRPRIRRVPV